MQSDNAGPDRIELDADFRREFAKLMNRVYGPSQYYQKQPIPAQFRRRNAQKLPSLAP